MEKSRKYTQEFKEKAVRLITDEGYQIAEAVSESGVNDKKTIGREIEGVGEADGAKKGNCHGGSADF